MTRLKTLIWVEERLLEAEYFADRLRRLYDDYFKYELDAFLSAARNVTWLLQKEMSEATGFNDWWNDRQKEMGNDPAMVFFRDMRNFSQKEGQVSMVGIQKLDSSGQLFCSYRFAGNKKSVPAQLLNRDVAECCREHLSKLAAIVLAFADTFPYHSCFRRAVTPEGLNALGLRLSDIEKILTFPRGWISVASIPQEEIFRILREHFDGVDFEEIQRIAEYAPEQDTTIFTPSDLLSEKLARNLVINMPRITE